MLFLIGTVSAGRYRVVRRHAEGGLGAVYLALDEELHREVALKEILERHAHNDESRQRFLLEAEVTGGLEHPGIVPVYGLGEYPDGRPYYAMKFIRGESLKKAVNEFHQAESPERDPGERALAFRRLLTHFVDVCEAIAYAHSRGVLHRDIKPENVMIGKFGETLVVDWGLAKPLGKTFSQNHETTNGGGRSGAAQAELESFRYTQRDPASSSPGRPGAIKEHSGLGTGVDPVAETLDLEPEVRPSAEMSGETLDLVSAPAPSLDQNDRTMDLGESVQPDEDLSAQTLDLEQESSSVPLHSLETLAIQPNSPGPNVDSSAATLDLGPDAPPSADRSAATLNLGSAPPPIYDAWDETLEERPLLPASMGRSSRTLAGSRMGTPAFMSPEQAAGMVDQLGPPSDIYSLGATLYNILTGEYPFSGGLPHIVLARVIKGEFAAPRKIKASIPPPVEAIVLKAMALKPEDRYPTAKALSEDLEHWMADEPVTAYPDPWVARLARWARRHKTTVSTAAALLLTAVIGLSGGSILLERERARTERERELAVKNYGYAYDAAETMLSRVGDVDLADIPQMEPVRRELLETAKTRLANLLGQRSEDPEIILLEGRTRARLGGVLEIIGQYVDAEKNYREALESLKALESRNPDDDRPVREIARAHHGLGVLLRKLNRFREAEEELREAVRLREQIALKSPSDRAIAKSLTDSRYMLGALLARLAGRPEDKVFYNQAIKDQQAELSLDPKLPENRIKLAQYRNNLAMLEGSTNPTFAEREYREIQELLSSGGLSQAQSSLPGVRWQLARSSNNLATVLFQGKPPREEASEAQLTKARDELARLTAEFPQIRQYRRELASVFNNLGRLALKRDQIQGAENAFRESAGLLSELAKSDPQVPDYQLNLSIALFQLEKLKAKTDLASAKEGMLRIISDQENLVLKHPEVPDYRNALGRNLGDYCRLLLEGGHASDSLPLAEKAATRFREALEGDPGNRTYTKNLFETQVLKILIALRMNNHRMAAQNAEGLVQVSPKNFESYLSAAEGLVKCSLLVDGDQTLSQEDREQQTEVYERRAVELLRDAVDRGLLTAPDRLRVEEFKPLRARQDFRILVRDVIERQQPVTG